MSEPFERTAFPLTFAVTAANPRVDLSLRAGDDGRFVVDVLTEWSLAQQPPAILGRFRGRLPPSTLARLAAVVAASRERDPGGAPPVLAPDAVVRSVSSGGESPVPAVGEASLLSALDREVADAVAGALTDPVAAIVAEARIGDGGPVLALRATGGEPFRLLLFASDTPGFWARTWLDTSAGPEHLEFEAIAGLVAAGAIPDGPVDLAPGAAIDIPLPPGAASGAAGGFIVWRAGEGPERRIVTGSWALP
jgi:hypothetical protein